MYKGAIGSECERTPSVSFADSSLKREPDLLQAALASLEREVAAAAAGGSGPSFTLASFSSFSMKKRFKLVLSK